MIRSEQSHQDEPKTPPAPGKKWQKVTVAENGQEVEKWIEVDAASAEGWPARSDMRLLDKDIARVDGPAKVTGAALYAHDMRAPRMVYARFLRCPKPAARIERIDVEAAARMPRVATAISLGVEETRFLGQPIAVVAAETPDAAEEALRAIEVAYSARPWVLTHEQAVAENAPLAVKRKLKEGEKPGNRVDERKSGDRDAVRAAIEAAPHKVEFTYTLPVQHHACLETHGVMVDFRGGDEAVVHASTQGTFTVHDDAAEKLGLPAAKVRANVQYMGGGFGSKFGLGIEGEWACELAKRLGRPVHLLLTRQDEFLFAGNRSGAVQKLAGAMAADGTLLALDAQVDKLGGVSRGSFPGQPYIYKVGQSSSAIRYVYTNTDSARAMRAPGHPQASFGIESLIDELAYLAGQDLLEVRKKNLEDEVYHRQLERVAREIGWYEHPHRTKPGPHTDEFAIGIGFAISTWGGGGSPACQVDVRIQRDGSVTATCGTQDLGTGTRTYMATIVAEVLGLPADAVEARIGSSEYGAANPSGGSTTTASLAPAVLEAALGARARLFAALAPALGSKPEALSLGTDGLLDAASGKRTSWKHLCALLPSEGLSARGEWKQAHAGRGVHGAQAAKVEVDTLTGRVRVLKMVGIHDCGIPLNRLALKSQINGGMIQALSYALLEERVLEPGLGAALNADFEGYKIAGTLEMPELVPLVDDDDTRQVVIGMSEAAIIPGHSAIANAVHNACGLRVRDLPLTPDKVLTGLEKLRTQS
jgi:xanthine dehydrogenase YagR molybdenum-binding subunit